MVVHGRDDLARLEGLNTETPEITCDLRGPRFRPTSSTTRFSTARFSHDTLLDGRTAATYSVADGLPTRASQRTLLTATARHVGHTSLVSRRPEARR